MRISLLIAALAVSLVAATGCSTAPALETGLRAAAAEGENFALSSIDSADGDAFLVVCPYESKESVSDRLGFAWTSAPDYAQSDDRQTVAIIGDGAVTSQAELARTEVDFCGSEPWELLPLETELTVTRADGVASVSPAGLVER